MKYLLFSTLYLNVTGFITFNKRPLFIKPMFNSIENFYHIKSSSTIISYNLEKDKKMMFQDEINEKTNNRFNILNDSIYVSLHDYSTDINNEIQKSKCQLFLYVHDNLYNLDGHYILETKDYKNMNDEKCIIFSFYENNSIFYTSISYYQYSLDFINYVNDLTFDFIYEHDQPYLKNIANNTKISYSPSYLYCSELKYKGVHWKKSNKVVYYKNNFYYK